MLLRAAGTTAGTVGRATVRCATEAPAAGDRMADTRVRRVPAVTSSGNALSVAHDSAERPVHDRAPDGMRSTRGRLPSVLATSVVARCVIGKRIRGKRKSRVADVAASTRMLAGRHSAPCADVTSTVGTRLPSRKLAPCRAMSTPAAAARLR